MQARNTDPNSPKVDDNCGNNCEDPAGNQYVIPRPSSLGQGGLAGEATSSREGQFGIL